MIFFNFALRNLKRHWFRSLLSTIGIVIGVVAIASLGIMGNSINLLVANVVTDVGDTVVVFPHSAVSAEFVGDPRLAVSATIPPEQVEEIRRAAGSNTVIPILQNADEISIGDKTGFAQVMGLKVGDIPQLLEIEDGQYLRENLPGAMVGTYLADEFDIRSGSRIRIGNETTRVMGILKERGFAVDINPDYAVIVSDRWYGAHFGEEDEYALVVIKVRDVNEIDAVKEAIDRQVNRREEMVDIVDSRDLLEFYDEIYGQITNFLIAIGAISLIIAAVNILNVMFISMTERVHEIGIMRSIGTPRRDVLRLFLYEALILGVIGSIIGGILSAVAGYVISVLAIEVFTAGTTFGEGASVLNTTAAAFIIGAMLFGIIVSTLSGLYPAWQAANLPPIEALRHE